MSFFSPKKPISVRNQPTGNMKIVVFCCGFIFFVLLFYYIKCLLKYLFINSISDVTSHLISLR